MPSYAEPQHVYARDIQPDEHSSLNLLTDLIGVGARVLDLGCGTGALGRWLAGRAIIDGVTFNEAEAGIARDNYRQITVGDLETMDLLQVFQPHAYDVIVCADVLEHLKNPAYVLEQCKTLLAPTGQVLISVPNAAYAGLIAELMHGQFRYRDEGLLDRTHLRFFTRSGLLDFLAQGGWHVNTTQTIQRELTESEFTQPFDALPPAVARYLLTQPDALTYQFIIGACPGGTASAQAPALSSPIATGTLLDAPTRAEARFSMELFWRTGDTYAQELKMRASGVIGRRQQKLRFTLPPAPSTYQGIRLDPADRPGFLHLFALRLFDHQGSILWNWDSTECASLADETAALASNQIHWSQLGFPASASLLILLGDDPWIELPIPSMGLEALSARGGSLEVVAGWPMSADYLYATDAMRSIKQAHIEQQAHAQLQAQTFAAEKLALQTELASTRSDLDSWKEKAHNALQERAQLLEVNQQAQRSLNDLQMHLRWIEKSTVFRLTRPLVRLKMALQRRAPSLLAKDKTQTSVPNTTTDARRPPPTLRQPVDVIVPVYKGLADTQRCILSALGSQCSTPWRLVIINDASPEPAVTSWLREIAAAEPRILLLENSENLGFVGTVNRGMALSPEADVLLLNSDTEVANDWLDRLCATAHAHPLNGTVTPFSNNATICSYPRFCEANTLPIGHTTASLDALISQTCPSAAVEVPTGIGFCMYIRRDCLNAVGLFDVPNFGKGYGEENDFCCRAHALGWRNLHALDTFVLHSGGVSFGESKSQRELDAMETLRRLHPRYESTVMRFIAADPAQPYRRAIDIARLQASPLPKVLCVVHDRAGGTLRHVRELAAALQNSAMMLMLTPAPGERVHLSMVMPNEEMMLEFQVHQQFDALVSLLRSIGVSLVHFHHLLGHAALIQTLPKRLGVPFDFTAHDHFSYCPQISLTDHRNRYCGEEGIAQCNGCLAKAPAPGGVDIVAWRNLHHEFLRQARHILAPSSDMAHRMEKFVPGADIRHAPHLDLGAEMTISAPKRPAKRPASAPLKVVVIGALSSIKGADVLETVATAARKANSPIEFHLLGYGYRSLKTQPKARLTIHGEYDDCDLPRLLEWLQPDVAWFPAQWPETYSYTLSACLAAGLPIVASDLGAFPDRLAGRSWSWIRPWNTSTEDWLEFFITLHRDYLVGDSPAPVCENRSARFQSAMPAWNYVDEYLRPSALQPPKGEQAPKSLKEVTDASSLTPYLPGLNRTNQDRAMLALRRKVLMGLVRLRSAPGLRQAARMVPLRLQTRVKSWLVR